MRQSYIDYAMSVISSRALPDVRDGLKPVHRRILFGMQEAGNTAERAFRKSAKTVGEVMGNYHPHGDAAIYDALVRLAQDFSMRYPLVDGHGNFGCFTGDTRIRLVDGTERSFAELAELGAEGRFYVYAVDADQRVVVAEGRNARITRRKAELVRVTLDNGEEIRCTPDHRFMLRDGTYKQAKDLVPEDSLMPGYFGEAKVRPDSATYLRIQQPDGTWSFVHHLADDFNERAGRARRLNRGYVRHHKNFNRFDNTPQNIERVTFGEHNRIHAEHLDALWADPGFRSTQRDGVKRYYRDNPAIREQLRVKTVLRNQDAAFREANGRRLSAALAGFYDRHPAMREALSRRQKELWSQADYRRKMSAALKGLVKRALTPVEKLRVRSVIASKSREMWANPTMRANIVEAIRRAMRDPELRRHLSLNAKRLWASEEYRRSFAPEHFKAMAHRLWADPETPIRHRAKLRRQQADAHFRAAQAEGVRRSNEKRMAQNPEMMSELAIAAASSLKKRWRDPEHRRRVMRSRIAGYGHRLLALAGATITRDVFEAHREVNVPHFEKAMAYFDSVEEFVAAARLYNHRIVRVEFIADREDVYDITVDNYHNFLLCAGVFVHNSIDGDPPAAMRYTEARLSKLAAEMLRDLDKNTVDFAPNYDESQQEPVVLPARFPNLLVNGSAGIAVGMATNIPPHNLREVIDATVALIDNPELTTRDLMRHVRGPDFPTGALILGREGIRQAYETGRGIVTMRANAAIEEQKNGRFRIVITEIPYQVLKSKVIERIAELAREKRIEGITDLRDETDRTGLRVVVELSKGANANVVLNKLYKDTPLQQSFGIILLALVDGKPRILSLRQMVHYYVLHQREVIVRRTRFELEKAERRAHILEGLRIALDQIDAVIAVIRGSKTVDEARTGLMAHFGLSEIQADAILEMRLQRLTGLEREKIEEEYQGLLKDIEYYRAVLASDQMVDNIIKHELGEVRARFGDERRTQITAEVGEFSEEDLIADEAVVVTLTHRGYIKRLPVDTYRSQGRGGRGVTGMATREEDFVTQLFTATTHDAVLFFTSRGKVHRLKVYEIPDAGRTARGTAAVNLIQLEAEEKITAVVPVQAEDEARGEERFLFMATRLGTVKKTALSEFANVRRSGITAVNLDEGDELIDVALTDGGREILLATRRGYALRFAETDVRAIGRAARGVRGIECRPGDVVIGMAVARPGADLLIVSERGFGKRTRVGQWTRHHRGTQGVRAMGLSEKRTGPLASVLMVSPGDEVMLISAQGIVIRLPVDSVSVQGRAATGVTLMRLDKGDQVVAVARLAARDGDEGLEV